MKSVVSQNGKEFLARLVISSYLEITCILFLSAGHFIALFSLTKILMASSNRARKLIFY